MSPTSVATTVVFYTDGSQGTLEGKTTNSAAICRISANQAPIIANCWNLGPSIEVADAEVIGIIKALEQSSQIITTGPTTFYLFVDSQAAIQRLQGYTYHAVKAQRLTRLLVNKGHKVEIQWCPSHVGVIGNEIADQLAKQGLEKKPEKDTYVSLAYLRRKAKVELKEAWKANWLV